MRARIAKTGQPRLPDYDPGYELRAKRQEEKEKQKNAEKGRRDGAGAITDASKRGREEEKEDEWTEVSRKKTKHQKRPPPEQQNSPEEKGDENEKREVDGAEVEEDRMSVNSSNSSAQ